MMQQCQRASAPPIVDDVLRTPGEPLDRATRAYFEPRFGNDFTRIAATQAAQMLEVGAADDPSEREADRIAASLPATPRGTKRADLAPVRVHTDARAAESARAVGARAYAVGSHIVFGAGEYAPHTDAGRRVLAHELAHVGQQSEGRVGWMLQRWLQVEQASKKAPNQPEGDPPLTNAQLVQTWVDSLCSVGKWKINPSNGGLEGTDRNAFCKTTTSTSCSCLCDVTKDGGPNIRVHTGDFINVPDEDKKGTGKSADLQEWGQGGTFQAKGLRTETHVGVTGREKKGLPGAGGRALFTPPWLIFAHEVCGHALGKGGHAQTPSGKESTVDIENRIRREHPADDLGIRRGDIGKDPHVAGPYGAEYDLAPGETLQSVAKRLGVTIDDIEPKTGSWLVIKNISDHHVIEGETLESIAKTWKIAKSSIIHDIQPKTGSRLVIKNISYHDVIKDETVESIAKMWKIAKSSLLRANPKLKTTKLDAGMRLVIPAK